MTNKTSSTVLFTHSRLFKGKVEWVNGL